MLDIQFNLTSTTIKTADLTYEGQGMKSSELCGILGFVDDQGHIHLSSNFDLYTMRPKLTDFNLTLDRDSNNETNKLDVRRNENRLIRKCIDRVCFFCNRKLILMKNLVPNKNVVQYIRKNEIQSKQLYLKQLYQLHVNKY
jgi:hypothetical protein